MDIRYTAPYRGSLNGSPITYSLAETTVDTGETAAERFGVAVEYSGQHASYPDVFSDRRKAEAFIALLYRGMVTPITLGDAVYDRVYMEEFA